MSRRDALGHHLLRGAVRYMRAGLLLLPFALVVFVVGGCPSAEEAVPRAPDALDCEWVKSDKNCWTTMAKALDACLGTDPTATGELSTNGLTCQYGTGRTITATISLIPPTDQDAAAPPSRDFTVTTATGTQCVHVQESNWVLTVSFAGSALRLDTAGAQVTLTCPDGAVFKGSQDGLRNCNSPSSGIPGYGWRSGDEGTTFSLLGMKAPLYACKPTPK